MQGMIWLRNVLAGMVHSGVPIRSDPRPSGLLDRALLSLEAAGVPYCLMRAPADTARWPRRDADLLVESGSIERLNQVLGEIGFVPIASRGGTRFFYSGHEPSTGERLKLDVATTLRYGGRVGFLRTPALDHTLSRRQYDAGRFVPEPADAFLCTLLHCILDKGEFRDHHRRELRRLQALLDSDPGIMARARERFESMRDALALSDVMQALREDRWEALLRRRRRIAWRLASNDPAGSALRWFGGKAATLARRVKAASGIGSPHGDREQRA